MCRCPRGVTIDILSRVSRSRRCVGLITVPRERESRLTTTAHQETDHLSVSPLPRRHREIRSGREKWLHDGLEWLYGTATITCFNRLVIEQKRTIFLLLIKWDVEGSIDRAGILQWRNNYFILKVRTENHVCTWYLPVKRSLKHRKEFEPCFFWNCHERIKSSLLIEDPFSWDEGRILDNHFRYSCLQSKNE
jgi:hypothetical protein